MSRGLASRAKALGLALACAWPAPWAGEAVAWAPKAPVAIILDTDMWGDIDDALALAVLHGLEARGEARILAITVSTSDPWCASYIDLVNTFYGRPDIPIGVVRDGVLPPRSPWSGDGAAMPAGAPMFTEQLATLRRADGGQRLPHDLTNGDEAPDSVRLLRRTLAQQPDGSVVMVGIGYATNFARLLDSPADHESPFDGTELVRRKVRLLSVMGGSFGDARWGEESRAGGFAEYNIRKDIPSAKVLFGRWPTAIVASGFEVGFSMRLKGAGIAAMPGAGDHPIAVTYAYMDPTYRRASDTPGVPHDHKTFDMTSVLQAVRPDEAYFSLSEPGTITVLDDGRTRFDASADGRARYLTIDDHQRPRTLEAMSLLASQPPARTRP